MRRHRVILSLSASFFVVFFFSNLDENRTQIMNLPLQGKFRLTAAKMNSYVNAVERKFYHLHQCVFSYHLIDEMCLPQPISNWFIYHTDFILRHSYYLLFNCLNYSSSFKRHNSIHQSLCSHSRLCSTLETKCWKLLGVYLKLFEIFDSQSVAKIQTFTKSCHTYIHVSITVLPFTHTSHTAIFHYSRVGFVFLSMLML